ncbi:hypothetical protein ACWGKU_06085 [Kitasatospora sp. NPDC054768]
MLAYDTAYHPSKTTTTIPGTEIGQGTTPFTYTCQAVHNPVTGAVTDDNRSAVGDIAAETVHYAYDVFGPRDHQRPPRPCPARPGRPRTRRHHRHGDPGGVGRAPTGRRHG